MRHGKAKLQLLLLLLFLLLLHESINNGPFSNSGWTADNERVEDHWFFVNALIGMISIGNG